MFSFGSLISLTNLSRFFLLAGIFVLPFRIQSLVYQGSAWSLGFFNEYAACFLTATDLCFLLGLLCYGLSILTNRHQHSFAVTDLSPLLWVSVGLVLMTTFISSFIAGDVVQNLFSFGRMLPFAAVAYVVVSGFLSQERVILIFAASLGFQSVLATAQFATGQSLGLAFIGEPIFSAETFNVAKIALADGTLVRGMGTLAHANILGGLLTAAFVLLTILSHKKWWHIALASLLLAGLFCAFSRSAWLALVLAGALLLFARPQYRFTGLLAVATAAVCSFLFLPLLLSRFSADTGDRLTQLTQAWEIFIANPLGVGAGQYTVALAELAPQLPSFALQPVHHFFVLVVVEWGVFVGLAWFGLFGVLAVLCLRAKLYSSLAVLLVIFVLVQFDHYLLTSVAGQGVLWLALGLTMHSLRGLAPPARG